jgi:diguanylate cyclase (GGDEF)-like protein
MLPRWMSRTPARLSNVADEPTPPVMNEASRPEGRFDDLFARATGAAGAEECAQLVLEIEQLLDLVTTPTDRGRLLMCRARVRSNQWQTAAVFEDARTAMRLFEVAGDANRAIDAASWAAAHASRMGEITVASELATKSLLALESIADDRLRVEIHNRLGIFCMSFLDYNRAVEQFDASLAVAEGLGDGDKIARALYNIADVLLVAARQRQLAEAGTGDEELERAEAVVRDLVARAPEEFARRAAIHRLVAEAHAAAGRPEEGLAVLDGQRGGNHRVASEAQRAALAWVEARCQRLAGRPELAVVEAERAVAIAHASDDDHELMLALEELAACQEAAGDGVGALATAREVKARMWTIHQRQTRQLVQEVWARADMVRNQTALQSQAAEAKRRAEEDALTGIGNRRVLEQFLADASADSGDVALVMIDIDRFKGINDTFGHRTGDLVLQRLGTLLRDEMRPRQVAVRYGGDEFVLGLLGVSRTAAASFAERLRERAEGLDWSTLAPGLQVTISAGVASGPRLDWRTVLSAADDALYNAKRSGRNVVVTAPAKVDAS